MKMNHQRIVNDASFYYAGMICAWTSIAIAVGIVRPCVKDAFYIVVLGIFMFYALEIFIVFTVKKRSLASIKESIMYTPTSLHAALPIPNDLVRYYVAPMVNYGDMRIAPTHRRHHRYYFRHVEVDFGRRLQHNPPLLFACSATPSETNDSVHRRIIQENAPNQPSYLGGYMFQVGGRIMILAGLRMIRTSIDKFRHCFKRNGMVVLLHEHSYTFLNPVGMSAITVPTNGLYDSELKLLR